MESLIFLKNTCVFANFLVKPLHGIEQKKLFKLFHWHMLCTLGEFYGQMNLDLDFFFQVWILLLDTIFLSLI